MPSANRILAAAIVTGAALLGPTASTAWAVTSTDGTLTCGSAMTQVECDAAAAATTPPTGATTTNPDPGGDFAGAGGAATASCPTGYQAAEVAMTGGLQCVADSQVGLYQHLTCGSDLILSDDGTRCLPKPVPAAPRPPIAPVAAAPAAPVWTPPVNAKASAPTPRPVKAKAKPKHRHHAKPKHHTK